MMCNTCSFCWAEPHDFPSCHWRQQAPNDIPPCEIEDPAEDPDIRMCDINGMCWNGCPDFWKCNG